ncbi:mucin-5AC-like isoform X2 [Labeo rohita]|uniref:Mucin-5AC-like isoform X2 n=1 Tax=Labeo rohita TaxID=84645 RepID=A0A498NX12_LABRO|nr:mucin-5AC-like isoform X2 [Labeo rohita]
MLPQTQPPNITTNLTQTSPPTVTNLTQTRPPNITTNPTQAGPLTVTNIITTSGSNTQSLEITSRDNCRRDRACFSAPPSCNPGAEGSCYFLSTRGVSGNANNFTFEISGESDGYIGAGLSRNSSGQDATVYSCANVNGVLKLIRSTLNNQILTQDNTFNPGSFRGSVTGRKIQCIFSASGLSSLTRAATTETFVFLLTGSVSNGVLDSPVSRLATSGSVDLSNPNSTDVSVIIPSTNDTASNITATTTTTVASTNLTQTVYPNMTTNLTQTHPPSMTTILNQGQDATVYSCANVNGVLKLIRSTLNNQILTQDNTFNPGSFRGSVTGRKIQCIFSASGLSSLTRAATTETFVFLLTGSVSNGVLDSPVSRLATSGSVDLSNPNSTDVSVIIPSTNDTASNITATTTTTVASTNLTQTVYPNMTTNLTQTHPPSMTTILNQDITGRDNCRRDRACFSAPPSCNPGAQDSCYFLSTRGVSGNADNFTFELSGESDGYIGAGLSRDSSGQGATVYSCANVNGALRFFRSTLNNQILSQDNTFIPGGFRGSLNGRKIQCIFTAAGLSSITRAATTAPYVFLLTGSLSNGECNTLIK